MDSLWIMILQLTFVTVVYCAAYRLGYRTAQSRIETIVKELNKPLKDLFERTQEEFSDLTSDNEDSAD